MTFYIILSFSLIIQISIIGVLMIQTLVFLLIFHEWTAPISWRYSLSLLDNSDGDNITNWYQENSGNLPLTLIYEAFKQECDFLSRFSGTGPVIGFLLLWRGTMTAESLIKENISLRWWFIFNGSGCCHHGRKKCYRKQHLLIVTLCFVTIFFPKLPQGQKYFILKASRKEAKDVWVYY